MICIKHVMPPDPGYQLINKNGWNGYKDHVNKDTGEKDEIIATGLNPGDDCPPKPATPTPTLVPPTNIPPTQVPPTAQPPTTVPPTVPVVTEEVPAVETEEPAGKKEKESTEVVQPVTCPSLRAEWEEIGIRQEMYYLTDPGYTYAELMIPTSSTITFMLVGASKLDIAYLAWATGYTSESVSGPWQFSQTPEQGFAFNASVRLADGQDCRGTIPLRWKP